MDLGGSKSSQAWDMIIACPGNFKVEHSVMGWKKNQTEESHILGSLRIIFHLHEVSRPKCRWPKLKVRGNGLFLKIFKGKMGYL